MNHFESSNVWRGKKVLIVDDSKLVREWVSEVAQSLGLEVCAEASDGVNALNAYEESNPDFVILDVIMPNMHGIECYKKLVQKHIGCKILFHSCLASDLQNAPQFNELAADGGVLEKPLSAEILAERLDHMFGELPPPPPAPTSEEADKSSQLADDAV